MLNTAANLRVHSCWDIETPSTVLALRALPRRAHAMLKEAREHQKAIVSIIRSWRPDLLEQFGVGPIVAATVLCAWSPPAAFTPRRRSRCGTSFISWLAIGLHRGAGCGPC
jgi:transposase